MMHNGRLILTDDELMIHAGLRGTQLLKGRMVEVENLVLWVKTTSDPNSCFFVILGLSVWIGLVFRISGSPSQ